MKTEEDHVTPYSKKEGLQVVVGLGQSGLSAVNFLLNQGYDVAITDGNESPTLAAQLPESVKIRAFGGIDKELLLQATRIIISPGIALETQAVALAKDENIPIVSDIQLFHEAITESNRDIQIIAITGSNAKSTVTTLVGEMARDAGVNVGVGGNIGVPALTLLDNHNMKLAVLELSSFQLESVYNLNAQVATILNLSPDHLDRHGDMEHYQALKQRIFDGAQSIVVNRNDAMTIPHNSSKSCNSAHKQINFGSDTPKDNQFGLITDVDGQVYLAQGQQKLLNTNELKIKGQHNQLNALSALALGTLVGLPIDSMLTSLTQFGGLPHRCQYIATINDVDYFNDSKGTNMGSTMAAIKGLGESYRTTNASARLMLILGGQGKGQDFSELSELINTFVSHVYYIGEDALNIEQQVSATLDQSVICQQVATLENAVHIIQQDLTQLSNMQPHHRQESDIQLPHVSAVLLSPACASFDQFTGYSQRGDSFINSVTQLIQ